MLIRPIAEAIAFADRVIVLSNRPAKIKEVYDINLTDASSPINNRNCKEFNYYYNKIWGSIDQYV